MKSQRRSLLIAAIASIGVGAITVALINLTVPTLQLNFHVPLSTLAGALALITATVLIGIRTQRAQAAKQKAFLQARFEAGAESERTAMNAQRSQFLERLDHELKNPMTALKIALANAAAEHSDATASAPLSLASRQASRIERILSDVRKLAGLETAELNVTAVQSGELLRELVESIRAAYPDRAHDVRLVVQAAPRLLPPFDADSDLLFLALFNIVSNAVKFSKAGDPIEIRASEESSGQRPFVRIEVADAGPGIASHDLPHIWKELHRGRDVSAVEGSGIGLSITRIIVEKHGGTATAHSVAGHGAVFTVRIPLTTHD